MVPLRSVRKTSAEPRTVSAGRAAWEWARSMGTGLLLFLVIRTFLLQTFTIISGSMENTFLIGDFVIVNKVAYGASLPLSDGRAPGLASPRRGDVVVFRSNHDDPPENIVKRLLAEPGDTIEMRGGTVFLNGAALREPYVQHVDPTGDDVIDGELLWQREYLVPGVDRSRYFPSRENWGPIIVPAKSYFMLGDNRDKSYDSRYWGFVKHEEIIGRAEVLYFSWIKGVGPRWGRIGDRVH